MGLNDDSGASPRPTSVQPPEAKCGLENGIDLHCPDRPRAEFGAPPALRCESLFRHSSWRERRSKVWIALQAMFANVSRLDRFSECGAQLWARYDQKSGEVSLTSNGCRDRWCEACGRDRAATVGVNAVHLVRGQVTRFITLTLKHSRTPLKDQVDRLYRSFLLLRKRAWWLQRVRGGAAFAEIKLSSRDGLWHPHLHVIVDSEWMEQRELSAEWMAITGDSSVVDIRLVRDSGSAAKYVTKYVTKPASTEVYASLQHLQELMIALKGRRLCTTFGTWRGHDLTASPESEAEWKMIGSVDQIWSAAHRGDAKAYATAHILLLRYPSLSVFGELPRPPTISDASDPPF